MNDPSTTWDELLALYRQATAAARATAPDDLATVAGLWRRVADACDQAMDTDPLLGGRVRDLRSKCAHLADLDR